MRKPIRERIPEVELKQVLSKKPPADGLGFEVMLSCGHEVWCAVEPGEQMHCGVCIDRFTQRAREQHKLAG